MIMQKQLLYDMKNIFSHSEGEIGFSGMIGILMNALDEEFRHIALSIGAEEEYYPVLLQRKSLEKTGYLKRSPRHCLFCANLYSEAEYVLSPSACFHVYEHYENCILSKMKVVTLRQNVFREEGDSSWREYGRLRDYSIREIVFIGNQKYVEKQRQIIMDKTKEFVEKLGMKYQFELATDAFMVPEMKKFQKIQLLKKSKYELLLPCREKGGLPVASFNLHENAYTRPFHIGVRELEQTVTGCVGFGLERWVLAFTSQFGYEVEKWPVYMREKLGVMEGDNGRRYSEADSENLPGGYGREYRN